MPLPPPFVLPDPPPPPFQLASPPPPWYLAPPPADESGIIVVRLIIGFAATLLAIFACSFCKGYRNSQQARAAAARQRQQQAPRLLRLTQELQPARAGTNPAAQLPAFTYSRSVKHNVTGGGGGEEAAACSVCLGALQLGEKVRLLPVCLHVYHVECIDPWLDAHSTCPLCRSDTDAMTEVGRLPPV